MKSPKRPKTRRREAPRPVPAPSAAPATDSFLARRGAALVLTMMAAYAALYAALSFAKYRHYLYRDFDLAIFAHAEDQILRGSLYESIGGMPWLGGHVAPILFLLAPLYALARHPLTLLLVQSVALALGGWAAFRLARHEVGGASAPVLCAALYLLYPALGYTNLFEFHPEALAVPALLFAFEALRAGRPRALALWAALALLTREDVALVVLAMGLYAALRRGPRRWLFAGLLGGLGLASLAVSFGWVMPVFGSGQTDYAQMFGRWGGSLREVVIAVLRDPLRALAEILATPGDPSDTALKRLYHLQMLLPLGFLPLASPATLLIPLPVLLEHFLSSRPSQHSIVFHYTSLITPFFVAAAVVGLGNVARRLRRMRPGRPRDPAPFLALLALAAALVGQALFGPVVSLGRLQGIGPPEPLQPSEEDRALNPFRDRMLARVPRGGDVVAGFEFLTRFTDRPGLHSLHHFLGGRYTFSTRRYEVPRGVVAVIADLGDGSLFKHVDAGTGGRWRELLRANGLRPVDSANDLVLFLRAPGDSLALCAPAAPTSPRRRPVVYDGQVAFVGSESGASGVAAGGVLLLHMDWRRVAPADRLFLTEMLVVDRAGRPVQQVWRYLGYTLHPVAEWPEGTVMRESYRLVVSPGLPPGRYDLGVRLWARGGGQWICTVDDAEARANQGFVAVAAFEVAGTDEARRGP